MKVFDAIYRDNLWNGQESRSGPGSGYVATAPVRDALLLVVRATGAESVLNVGCGDDLWTPELPGYLGLDISELAIERARVNHPERAYELRDARKLRGLPVFDLAICRDAIQHCSLSAGLGLVRQVRAHSRWMLLSTYAGSRNYNVATGRFYSPDLTAPPFALPQPWLMIPDGWDYGEPGKVRDPAKYLGLWPTGQ